MLFKKGKKCYVTLWLIPSLPLVLVGDTVAPLQECHVLFKWPVMYSLKHGNTMSIPAFHPFKLRGFVHVTIFEEVAVDIIILSFAVTLFRIASIITISWRTFFSWYAFVPTLATFFVKKCLGWGKW
jgi:hypothetical protein